MHRDRSPAPLKAPLLALLSVSLIQGCGGLEAPKAFEERPADGRHQPQAPSEPEPGPLAQDMALVPILKKRPDGEMFFKHYGVNPTVETAAAPLSTFSVDVDTASFHLARAAMDRGVLPQEAAVRVEEFINAFDYDITPPAEGPFAIEVDGLPSPNRAGYHLLRLSLKGREITAEARKPADLVFVVDVSGSMNRGDRLGLVIHTLRWLTSQLRPDDTVAVVTYGSEARVLLPRTGLADRERIDQALSRLHSEGSTNAQAGLELAYGLAGEALSPDRTARVILCSDGVANTGLTDADTLYGQVRHHAEEGVLLTTVGVGMGHYNDVLMERLAQIGQGRYLYVDREDEARKAFGDALTGNLEIIARDVKLQVAFNPATVARYRLIGYENRMLAARDFEADGVDAGEVGAGHTVTALYEVRLTGAEGDLGELRVRHRPPQGGAGQTWARPLPRESLQASVSAAAPATRLSVAVGGFGEKLRGAYWARGLTYGQIIGLLEGLPLAWQSREEVRSLKDLVARARKLDQRADRFESEMPLARMDFDHVPILSDSSGGQTPR